MLILRPGDKVPADYKGDGPEKVVNQDELNKQLDEVAKELDRMIAEKRIVI